MLGIYILYLPAVQETITPMVYTVPLRPRSYHVAVLRGTDVGHVAQLGQISDRGKVILLGRHANLIFLVDFTLTAWLWAGF